MLTTKLPATIEHLKKLVEFISGCAREKGFTDKRIREIELATEEALVNIFSYAYPEKAGNVEVTCDLDVNDRLKVEILDSGVLFNPLSLSDPDLTTDVANRKIGGLGVFLIRKIVDDIQYRRDDDRNILTFRILR